MNEKDVDRIFNLAHVASEEIKKLKYLSEKQQFAVEKALIKSMLMENIINVESDDQRILKLFVRLADILFCPNPIPGGIQV